MSRDNLAAMEEGKEKSPAPKNESFTAVGSAGLVQADAQETGSDEFHSCEEAEGSALDSDGEKTSTPQAKISKPIPIRSSKGALAAQSKSTLKDDIRKLNDDVVHHLEKIATTPMTGDEVNEVLEGFKARARTIKNQSVELSILDSGYETPMLLEAAVTAMNGQMDALEESDERTLSERADEDERFRTIPAQASVPNCLSGFCAAAANFAKENKLASGASAVTLALLTAFSQTCIALSPQCDYDLSFGKQISAHTTAVCGTLLATAGVFSVARAIQNRVAASTVNLTESLLAAAGRNRSASTASGTSMATLEEHMSYGGCNA
ncbi:MAG: hypothetical protein NTZ67_07230 [Gammaproteobacteria bacterium]|nr:hypothetical protein [Gammaproteobacteria bacterium]